MSGKSSVVEGQGRHRVLANGSRVALLRVLEGSSSALDTQVLAERVGLHVNTVRWHLGILAEAGFVLEETPVSAGRGRPRHLYRLFPGALDDQPGGFRLLAELLVAVVERRGEGDLAKIVEDVGRARGTTLVRPQLGGDRPAAKEAIDEIVRLLEVFGFQPRLQSARGGQRIAMHPCPFGEIAAQHPSTVCQLHLGLMRGALETLRAPVEATRLEPFVRPDLCLVHLQSLGPERA